MTWQGKLDNCEMRDETALDILLALVETTYTSLPLTGGVPDQAGPSKKLTRCAAQHHPGVEPGARGRYGLPSRPATETGWPRASPGKDRQRRPNFGVMGSIDIQWGVSSRPAKYARQGASLVSLETENRRSSLLKLTTTYIRATVSLGKGFCSKGKQHHKHWIFPKQLRPSISTSLSTTDLCLPSTT